MNDIYNQESVELTPELRVVMEELGLSERSIGLGLSKGYEARLIDPDGPCAIGNVIWAPSSQLDAWQSYMDREVLGAFEDAKRAVTIAAARDEDPFDPATKPLYTEAQLNEAIMRVGAMRSELKGHEAYERRLAGEPWAAISPNALNNAKAYARSHRRPWPPARA